MATKQFHLGDVLSITTGRLLPPNLMGGIYAILGYMTGESLFTHQLARALAPCREALLRQHPQLAKLDPDLITTENCHDWLAEKVAIFGESLPVEPLPAGRYEPMDPVEEFVKDKHKENPDVEVVVVAVRG